MGISCITRAPVRSSGLFEKPPARIYRPLICIANNRDISLRQLLVFGCSYRR